MTENPPPAPDWILGPDGHWRPPPFEVGRPVAAPPPPGMVAGPPPGRGPAPGPSSRRGGVVAALVLGLVGIGALAVGAVTFLGRTPPERESLRLSPVEEAADPADPTDPAASDPGAAPAGSTLSEQAARRIGDDLEGEGWAVQEAEPVPTDEAGATCMPAGWREGVTDRFRIAFHADGIGDTEVRTSAYGTPDQAQADLARASSEEFRACLERSAEEHTGVDVTVQALPADPTIPGITYRSTAVTADGQLVQDDTYTFVGRVRAYVTYCTCEALDEGRRREVAQEVAAALAAAQGVPGPG